MYADRVKMYRELAAARNSNVLTYVTSTRLGRETQIHSEVLDFFADHLDAIGPCEKISLILHSNGGITLSGWAIINLIRMFCDELEVIIPFKALSTATLMAIGADKIIMTKQATLGPIDPSTNGPFNPQFPVTGSGRTMPVSVEFVAGFLDLAKSHKNDGVDIGHAFLKLCDSVHPLALGNVHRSRNQIQMLARKLLSHHMDDDAKKDKIVSFLCSESGSHDYTINRREALDNLCLPVEKPDAGLYELIKRIYKDFSSELELASPYSPLGDLAGQSVADYEHVRGLVESVDGGTHKFVTRGKVIQSQIEQPSPSGAEPYDVITDKVSYEGWEHEEPNAM